VVPEQTVVRLRLGATSATGHSHSYARLWVGDGRHRAGDAVATRGAVTVADLLPFLADLYTREAPLRWGLAGRLARSLALGVTRLVNPQLTVHAGGVALQPGARGSTAKLDLLASLPLRLGRWRWNLRLPRLHVQHELHWLPADAVDQLLTTRRFRLGQDTVIIVPGPTTADLSLGYSSYPGFRSAHAALRSDELWLSGVLAGIGNLLAGPAPTGAGTAHDVQRRAILAASHLINPPLRVRGVSGLVHIDDERGSAWLAPTVDGSIKVHLAPLPAGWIGFPVIPHLDLALPDTDLLQVSAGPVHWQLSIAHLGKITVLGDHLLRDARLHAQVVMQPRSALPPGSEQLWRTGQDIAATRELLPAAAREELAENQTFNEGAAFDQLLRRATGGAAAITQAGQQVPVRLRQLAVQLARRAGALLSSLSGARSTPELARSDEHTRSSGIAPLAHRAAATHRFARRIGLLRLRGFLGQLLARSPLRRTRPTPQQLPAGPPATAPTPGTGVVEAQTGEPGQPAASVQDSAGRWYAGLLTALRRRASADIQRTRAFWTWLWRRGRAQPQRAEDDDLPGQGQPWPELRGALHRAPLVADR
jgi:hypothetical protein